jgi:hypothetical protein
MATASGDSSADDVDVRLRTLAAHIETEFGPGVVEFDDDASGGFGVQPREGACPVNVLMWGDELIFGMDR